LEPSENVGRAGGKTRQLGAARGFTLSGRLHVHRQPVN
jgi:hypothetical protein